MKKKKQNLQLRIKRNSWSRQIVQAGFALATNWNLSGWWTGRIYQGPTKSICVPGLQCYSCPSSTGACPIGSLQAQILDPNQQLPFYILSFLMLIGLAIGRFVCGWLCPFGWFQELLHKLPGKKIKLEEKLPRLDKYLRYVKYLFIIFLVVLIPLIPTFSGEYGAPMFCKTVCPAGTIFAGWPLVSLNEGLRPSMGFYFIWKGSIALFIIGLSYFTSRPFCRYFCPLGGIYGLMNKFSFVRLNVSADKCISCRRCTKVCPMGVNIPCEANSPECIRCTKCVAVCPTKAISISFPGKAV